MLKTVSGRKYSYHDMAISEDRRIVVGQASHNTTADSKKRKVEYIIQGRKFLITFDGKLNFRESLLKKINQKEISDSEIILHAYLKWNDHFIEHIEGEFAFCLVDINNNVSFLARDQIGFRQLFYNFETDTLIWSSEIKSIHSQLSFGGVNYSYLVHYLLDQPESREDTAYLNIKRVEPGQMVIFKNGRKYINNYYSFSPKEVVYKKNEDYVEHFKQLLFQSVRNSIQCSDKIGFSLSGGLDSSSIVSIANKINSEENLNLNFHTYSYVFEKNKESDESEYINSVISKYPSHHTAINCDDEWSFKGNIKKFGEFDEPYPLFSYSLAKQIPMKMASENVNIVVSGHCGDHVLMGNLNYLAKYFKQGQIIKLLSEYSKWSKQGIPLYDLIKKYTLSPIIKRKNSNYLIPSWLNLKDIKNKPSLMGFYDDDVLWDECTTNKYFNSVIFKSGHEWVTQYIAKSFGIETRYPFLEKNLMEFLAGTPVDVKNKPGLSKYILREATQGILPEIIRKRTNKSGHSSLISTGVKKEWQQISQYINCPMLSEFGLINSEEFERKFKQFYMGNVEYFSDIAPLTRTLSLEIWLQQKYGLAN